MANSSPSRGSAGARVDHRHALPGALWAQPRRCPLPERDDALSRMPWARGCCLSAGVATPAALAFPRPSPRMACSGDKHRLRQRRVQQAGAREFRPRRRRMLTRPRCADSPADAAFQPVGVHAQLFKRRHHIPGPRHGLLSFGVSAMLDLPDRKDFSQLVLGAGAGYNLIRSIVS